VSQSFLPKQNINHIMNTNSNSKGWNITLWILQIILAALFLLTGITKVSTPINELAAMMPWVESLPAFMVRFIGASEFLGAIGLLLPSLLRIRPVLTSLAAGALALVMVMATLFHISRGEFETIGFNFVIALLAGLVAWGRFMKASIATR
jgi:uncharacterized membrane protein YphA (DoxX/SURF4 family)